MDSIELKPCPFCGGTSQNIQDQSRVDEAGAQRGWAYVMCECDADGPYRGTVAEAVDAWNTRAPIKAAAEQEPSCYASKIGIASLATCGHIYAESKKTQTYVVPLYTHPIASEDKWKEAIWHECMMTEAVAPDEADPIGTIKALVSYHVDLAASEDSERLAWLSANWFYKGENGEWGFNFTECWNGPRGETFIEAIDAAGREGK